MQHNNTSNNQSIEVTLFQSATQPFGVRKTMSCPELIERYKKPYAIDMDHGYYHETTTKEERNKAKSIGGIVFGTFKENYRSNHYVEQRYCINFDIDQAPAPTSKALEQIKSALGEHD